MAVPATKNNGSVEGSLQIILISKKQARKITASKQEQHLCKIPTSKVKASPSSVSFKGGTQQSNVCPMKSEPTWAKARLTKAIFKLKRSQCEQSVATNGQAWLHPHRLDGQAAGQAHTKPIFGKADDHSS